MHRRSSPPWQPLPSIAATAATRHHFRSPAAAGKVFRRTQKLFLVSRSIQPSTTISAAAPPPSPTHLYSRHQHGSSHHVTTTSTTPSSTTTTAGTTATAAAFQPLPPPWRAMDGGLATTAMVELINLPISPLGAARRQTTIVVAVGRQYSHHGHTLWCRAVMAQPLVKHRGGQPPKTTAV
nr:hypothetical protein [Tanacetum cinerariifolium]